MNKLNYNVPIVLLIKLLLFMSNFAIAEVNFKYEIPVEIQNDYNYSSDEKINELNDLYTTIEPWLLFSVSETLSLESTIIIEPVLDTDPGKNRYFKDEALYVEEIKLNFKKNNFSIFGGKFNPSFGSGWDLTAGLYGADLCEDYEITGVIGIGTLINLPIKGKHKISLNTFFADTSFLSKTTNSDIEQLKLKDGGASNTEDLSSYTITFDGEIIQNLNYHLGYRFLSQGEDDINDETGIVLGLEYSIELNNEMNIVPFIEYASLKNTGGSDEDASYLTTSLALKINSWNYAISYTKRDISNRNTFDINDYQYQFSGGFTFENGLSIDLGWKEIEEESIKTKSIGLLFAYSFTY